MARSGFDLDTTKARAQVEARAARMKAHAAGILADASTPLESKVVEYAPRDTGLLESSVFTELRNLKSGPVLIVGIRQTPYAVYVEFGTSDTDAQPFLRPAIEDIRGEIQRRTRATAKRSGKTAWRKTPKRKRRKVVGGGGEPS